MPGKNLAGYRRTVAALRALAVASLVTYAGLLLRPSISEPLTTWLPNLVTVAAAALCLTRALRAEGERAAWLSMGAGLAVYTVGNLVWLAWIRHLDPAPYPSLADLLFLGFYPFAYATLVLAVRDRAIRFPASLWLDGLVGGLGAAAVGSALAFRAILADVGGSAAQVATNLAFPIADLLLLVLVVGAVALTGWRSSRSWWLLASGFLLFAVADTVYLLRVASGTYQAGTWLDLLWPGAATLIGLAASLAPGGTRSVRLEGWTVAIIPSLFSVSSLFVLVLGYLHPIPMLAVVLATGCVLAGTARMALTLREVRSLAESRRQAHTDELTGLGNRRLLYAELDTALATRGTTSSVALLLADLDRFKEVNDALGHDVGDQLLRLVGPRMASALRPEDVLVRLGGDEFAMLLRDADPQQGAAVAARLLAALGAPFILEGVALHVDASIGIAICPDHATERTTLLQCADVAMYRAKTTRTGWQLYAFAPNEHSRDRLQMTEDLRAALARDEFVLHYQPKVDLRNDAVVGVEALVRWAHPAQGLLYPDAFLPLAEQTGLMRPLTSLVLRAALKQCSAWRQAGLGLSVAVNLSVGNLLDAHLPVEVGRLLAEFGLPPSVLEVEITEGTLMADPVRSDQVLHALRRLGVRVAVDDYGTGYSSLAYLQQLPIDELKLDKSFVVRMLEDPGAGAIVRTTIDLAHSLGLRLVAEGVESEAHLRQLAQQGCDVAQGYHLSRPLPANELQNWVMAQRTRHEPGTLNQPTTTSAAPSQA